MMKRNHAAPCKEPKVVTLFQEWVPEYRQTFFLQLHEKFAQHGVEFHLVAGNPSKLFRGRPVANPEMPFLRYIKRFDFRVGSKRLSWSRINKHVQASDLLIFEQARRNLELYPLLLLRKKGISQKIVLWGHGYDHRASSSISIRLLSLLTSKADALFIYKRDSNIEYGLEDGQPIFEIGNSLYTKAEVDQINASKNSAHKSNSVLFIGALTEAKKVKEFLELAEHSFKAGRNWSFVVAGTGPMLQELESSNLPNLNLVGAVGGADKAQLIAKSMCLVIPDSIGLVAIDAIVHEKLIFTNANSESHGPEYGYLKDSGLARLYDDLFDLEAQLEDLERSAHLPKSLVGAPTLEEVIDRYVNACLELLHPGFC